MASSPIADQDSFPCPGCGYDLRGLPRTGRCPECGGPVEAVFAASALHFADPNWLRTMALGTRLASWSWAALVGGVLLTFLVYALSPANRTIGLSVFTVAPLVWMVLLGGGLWLCTASNPATSSNETPLSPRPMARYALIGGLAALAGLYLAWRQVPLPRGDVLLTLFGPFGVPGMVFIWCFCQHFEGIANIVRSEFDGQRARVYRKGFAIGWVTGLVGLLVGPWFPIAFVLLLPAVALVLIFGVLAMLLPSYLAGEIQRAAAVRSTMESAS